MNLLPAHIRKQLPKLYATEHVKPADKIAVVKFFIPDASWSWYVCEFDGRDTFFGFVIGLEAEWGYFSLAELQSVRGPLGLPIERDAHWQLKPMREAEPKYFAEGRHE
jgi:hypothetical protein